MDGELFSHENWTDGEPNDYNGESEECMEIHIDEGWNDIPCYLPFMWICETTPAYLPYNSGPTHLPYSSGPTNLPYNTEATYLPSNRGHMDSVSRDGSKNNEKPNDIINSAQLGWTDRMIQKRMEKFNKDYWQKIKGMDQHYKKIAQGLVNGNEFMEAVMANIDTARKDHIGEITTASSKVTKPLKVFTKVSIGDYATSAMSTQSSTQGAKMQSTEGNNEESTPGKEPEQREKQETRKPTTHTECTETTTQSFMVTVET